MFYSMYNRDPNVLQYVQQRYSSCSGLLPFACKMHKYMYAWCRGVIGIFLVYSLQ